MDNPYLSGPVGRTYLRTALPIILLTGMSGLFAVADAAMLGLWVGPEALAGVTAVFPLSMLLAALVTTVASGLATVAGQRLGAGRAEAARAAFAGAHGLALVVAGGAMLAFAVGAGPATLFLAGGSEALAGIGRTFLGVSVVTLPLLFLMSLQFDGLRSEGQVGVMALAGLAATAANLGLNAAFILGLGWGVAGSALGTAAAQGLAWGGVLLWRRGRGTALALGPRDLPDWREGWGAMLALGAPRSLSLLGVALGSGAVIAALRLHGGAEATVAAYGIITRVMTFAYLPLLGLALALGAMVSQSHGAGRPDRSRAALRVALGASLCYVATVEAGLLLGRGVLGPGFTDDPAVAAEVARVLPFYVALYVVFGPCLILANHLQALGDAKRAALLSLARTYGFAVPLTFLLPLGLGEPGIWVAQPLADLGLLLVAGLALRRPGRIAGGPAVAVGRRGWL